MDGTTRATIRLGLIGCADVAVRRVLPAVAGFPGMELVRVAGRSPERAQKVAADFGATAVGGYEELLEDPDVDAVYLPLPAALHARWAEAALRAGKHVLAEKPLTGSARDTEWLHELAVRGGLVLRENYMFLAHRLHARVAELIADGAVGEPRSFHAVFAIPPRAPGDIRLAPELGGGALLDTGGYPVRAAIRFFGTELEAVGAVLRYDAAAGVDIGGSALLRGPHDIAVHCEFGIAHGYASGYRVLGRDGSIAVDHVFTTPADHAPVIRIRGVEGTREETVPPEDQFAASAAAFAADIRARRRGTHAATRAQARIIDRVRELAQGRVREAPPAPPGGPRDLADPT